MTPLEQKLSVQQSKGYSSTSRYMGITTTTPLVLVLKTPKTILKSVGYPWGAQ